MRYLLLCATLCVSCSHANPVALNEHQTETVLKALSSEGLPEPQTIVVESGRLILTFELGESFRGSPRVFGEKALLAVRNAVQPLGLVSSYRVTVNGPPPGQGLVRRYGSARFTEGGTLAWSEGR